MTRLFVNVDHVATIREARKTVEPDPILAAQVAELYVRKILAREYEVGCTRSHCRQAPDCVDLVALQSDFRHVVSPKVVGIVLLTMPM